MLQCGEFFQKETILYVIFWNEYFYPINSDGSLDGDNVIIESRIYNRKNRLWE